MGSKSFFLMIEGILLIRCILLYTMIWDLIRRLLVVFLILSQNVLHGMYHQLRQVTKEN